MYGLVDHTSMGDALYGDEIVMKSDSVNEVESLQEIDILKAIQNQVLK